VVDLVKANENREVQVKLMRKQIGGAVEEKELQFIPKQWGGTGLLGCALKLQQV